MITYEKIYQSSAQTVGATTVVTLPTDIAAVTTDHAEVRINSSTNSVIISSATVTANTLTVVFSGAPGDGEFSYSIIRPRS